jgi:hypothetical protein
MPSAKKQPTGKRSSLTTVINTLGSIQIVAVSDWALEAATMDGHF